MCYLEFVAKFPSFGGFSRYMFIINLSFNSVLIQEHIFCDFNLFKFNETCLTTQPIATLMNATYAL